MKTLSILIPVYNEANTIELILDKIDTVELPEDIQKQYIVVNDCSTDTSEQVINNYVKRHSTRDILFLQHKKNQGKGAAIHSAITAATGDYIIIQDADLEYDPNEYVDLLKPMLLGCADVVYGSRFIGSNPHRIFFFWHTMGNKLLTFFSNAATNLNLTDMECCYKLFRKEVIKDIKLKEKRFGFEPEVTAKIARNKKVRLYEVGVSYYGRSYDEGKKIGWKDGVRAIYCILKYGVFGR